MATLKSIQVTQCDNELIGLAVPSGGTFSTELFHFKLGGGTSAAPINYTMPNIAVLPPGNYTLLLIGINWGGPANFEVTVHNTTGPAIVLQYGQANPGVGVVWTPAGVPITV
jgi:hypothetical protein